MAQQLQEANIPEWMTKGKITQKDPRKGTIPSNYKPIMFLPIIWKILTALIKEEIYYLRDCRGLFLKNKKHAEREQKEQLIYCI